MNAKSKSFKLAPAFLAALGATGAFKSFLSEKEKPKTKPTFTEEETQRLSSLFGKAKKAYIAELKAKYYGLPK